MSTSLNSPWKNPEDNLISSKFDPDFIPPPQPPSRRVLDGSPLRTLPPVPLSNESAMNMDCIIDTLQFMKLPLIVASIYGATMAASLARPISTTATTSTTWITTFSSGIKRELKYLHKPLLLAGGLSGLYQGLNCSIAKLREKDTVLNSAIAASITGVALGLYQRNPNSMFIYGVYGGVLGGVCKAVYLNPSSDRAKLTYYEMIEQRRRLFRPEVRDGLKGAYQREYLVRGLEELGVDTSALQ